MQSPMLFPMVFQLRRKLRLEREQRGLVNGFLSGYLDVARKAGGWSCSARHEYSCVGLH